MTMYPGIFQYNDGVGGWEGIAQRKEVVSNKSQEGSGGKGTLTDLKGDIAVDRVCR